MKRVVVFGIIFIVLLAVVIIYLNVARRVDPNRLILSGVVEAEEIALSFRIPGLVTDIFFDESDHVHSGVVVALLDKSELNTVVIQAQKNYEAHQAAIKNLEVSLQTIKRNLDKIKSLLPTGAATQSQYDDLADQQKQVRAQLEHSQKNLEAAKSAVDMANIRLSYAELISPAKGTVLSRVFEPGEVVMPGASVIVISDLDNLTIKVYLPEIFLGTVKLGQEVDIQIDSHPGKSFPGKIKYISDKAEFTPKNVQTKEERVKQVFAIEISSDGQNGILKPGLPCDVVIPLHR